MFESWKLISATDRGDNNTFRFILGNDIAVKAAQSGNISPWPDGTRFAKVAWQQKLGEDGLIHPGKFVQVELMVKDARRYKDMDGWGWGRWRGLDLHYEIAGYGTAREMADRLGHKDVSELLNQTLKEEEETDQKLTQIAKKS